MLPGRCSQNIILVLQPGQLSFEVAHPSPEAAHLRQHARIRPADVPE